MNKSFNLGQYGKFFAAAAGLAVTILTQKYAGADWLPYVVGTASALGVYATPNTPKMLEIKGEQVSTIQPGTYSTGETLPPPSGGSVRITTSQTQTGSGTEPQEGAAVPK